MPQEVTKVKKRDGRIVDFAKERITQAIFKALTITGQGDDKTAKKLSDKVVKVLSRRFKKAEIPEVEQVQDIIEEVLMLEDLVETARSYILYREQRRRIREADQIYDEAVEIYDKYIDEMDWQVKENSNMAYSLQGLNNYGVSTLTKRYWLNKIYPKQIREAIQSGDFHVHDLDFLGAYCCGWDLYDLLKRGFGGVPGKVESKPPKHFRAALGQVVNFFYTLQGEAAGAIAFSNFDTLLAPFIRYDKLDYPEVKQAMQEFLFNCAVPTRVGFQCMSEDTEILTPEGWKGYGEVKQGDIIKTFNIETGEIENKKVSRVFREQYQGPMYSLKNRIQDQLISPKHRIVRKKFNTNRYALEPIEDAMKLRSPIIIPVAGNNANSDAKISDEQIKLMAWIISEGTVARPGKHRCCYRVSIYQSKTKNKKHYDEIIHLLKHFKLQYSEGSTASLGDEVHRLRLNAESSRVIHGWFGTRENVHFVPKKLMSMSEKQSRLFLDTFLKGDGFEGCKIATTDLDLLDGLQTIAVNSGFGFTVLNRKPTIGNKDIYVLRLIRHPETTITKIEKVQYKGIIWCPNTGNQTVVARRNGKVFITGNTPFSNITVDIKPSPSYAKQPVILGGELQKETYGEFQEEINTLNKALYESMIGGDKNGRIFSVDADCFCPIKNSEKTKLVKIGDYIDRLMKKRKPIFIKQHNCEVLDVRDLGIKCLGLKEQKIDWQQVNFLVRHPLNKLLRVWTKGGFNIKLSPSHSVFVLKDGQIRSIKASGLKKGDYLISPKIIPAGESKIFSISLAEEFVKKQKTEGVYVRAVLRQGKEYRETRTVLHKRNYGKKEYRYPSGVSVFPLSNIASKKREFDFSEAELSLAGSAIKIKNILPITPELIEFLGWYCAEGSAEKNEKYGGLSLAFNLNNEKQIAYYVGGLVKKVWPGMPVKFREIKERNLVEVRVHSKLLRRVITEIFKVGNGLEKRVPQIIFELPDVMKKTFLNAYFKGDGWITENVMVNSISRELIYGVSTLLKQIGVFHTLTEYEVEGRLRWRVNIFRNKNLEVKDSHTISKIPIKESGLEGVVEKILKRKPHYYDSLGRGYRSTKNRVFKKCGISFCNTVSTSLEKAKKVLQYAEQLAVEIPEALKGIKEGNFLFLRVQNVEEVKTSNGMVYDFSTESESFVADQLLVHNTFPIPTINITKDFPWDEPALEPMWQATAKYGVNYFANFIQSDMNPEDVRSMCCRLRLSNKELYKRGGGLFGANPLTGSLGVVTVNLPRLGYLSKTKKEFFQRLDRVMDLAKESLEIKRKAVEDFMRKGLYPYSRHYLEGVEKMRGSYYGNHFSTIGLLGMNECLLNFMGEDIASENGRKFTLEMLDYMRERMVKYQEETGNLYNLEATPAEGASYKLCLKDRAKYPDIITAGTKEVPYYTNSTQLSVNFTDDIFEALELQDQLQCKYTGGCIQKGNKVLTDKGLLLIEDIVRNFNTLKPLKALSYNTQKKTSEWDEIVKAVSVDVRKHDKIRIKGERNLDITTSDWHPFFVLKRFKPNPACPICETEVRNLKAFASHIRWNEECGDKYKEFPKYQVVEKRADELRVGDYILQNSTNSYPDKKTELNEDLMWLIGFFIGDGCVSKFIDNRGGNSLERYKVRFHSEHQEPLQKVADVLRKYFDCQAHVIKNEKRSEVLKEVTTSKREVSEFFFKYGFSPGKKCYNVSISERVKENLTQSNVFSFLSGLVDSDGHIGKRDGDCEYYTVSPQLAEDILEICSIAGVMISKTLKPTKRKNELDIWRLRIPQYEMIKMRDKVTNTVHLSRINYVLSGRKKRHLPVVRVKEVSKIEVEDNQFYDLMTEKNHNYLAGKDCLVFIHNTVLHFFLGEQIQDTEAIKALIKKIFTNFRLPYVTLTPTFSVCPIHGYLAGEHWTCPKCTIEQKCEVYSRVVGYIRPISQWHEGKAQEFKDRKVFKLE